MKGESTDEKRMNSYFSTQVKIIETYIKLDTCIKDKKSILQMLLYLQDTACNLTHWPELQEKET